MLGIAELDELAKHEIVLDLAGPAENVAPSIAPGIERVGERGGVEIEVQAVLGGAFATGIGDGFAGGEAGTDAAGLGPAGVGGGVAEGGEGAAGLERHQTTERPAAQNCLEAGGRGEIDNVDASETMGTFKVGRTAVVGQVEAVVFEVYNGTNRTFFLQRL